MQLMRFTDYALRVLLFVGQQDGRVCNLAQIASFYRISREHLRKVVHRMARLGYLRSSRGRGGGLLLGREAGRICIGDLVEELENGPMVIDCDALECRLRLGCSLKTVLDRAGRAFLASLKEVTLADLLADGAMQHEFTSLDVGLIGRPRASQAATQAFPSIGQGTPGPTAPLTTRRRRRPSGRRPG